jgi:plasmid stabilization system protein ParE
MIRDLERAVARVAALPDDVQALAACLLDELLQNQARASYVFSDEENALIDETIARKMAIEIRAVIQRYAHQPLLGSPTRPAGLFRCAIKRDKIAIIYRPARASVNWR